MTVWLLGSRSQTGHAGLLRELSDQVDHVLDYGANTDQDRDQPFHQLEKLAHGVVQKKPAARRAIDNPRGAGTKKPAGSGLSENIGRARLTQPAKAARNRLRSNPRAHAHCLALITRPRSAGFKWT